MKTTQFLAATFTAGALTLVSCTPTQQQYGAGGAIAAAGVTAIAGGDSGDIVKAAAIGGAAGAGYGAYKDHQNKQRGAYNSGGDTTTRPAPPTPPPSTNYPTATRSNIPGVVISPYKPHNKIRVTNFKPGDLAKDPKTQEIFVVPQ